MSEVLALFGGMIGGFGATFIIWYIKDNAATANNLYRRGYEDALRDGIKNVMNDCTKFLEGTILSYNDTKVGDRVRILGTVTDISESGVQTIRPDTDSEGYVRARKIEGKEDDHD